MAFGKRRSTTRTRVIVVLLIVLAIAVPTIGPFTFYGALVPYLTPVIPKPEGVPGDARAAHNWKGPGLYWQWERTLPSGLAKWTLAEDRWIAADFYGGGPRSTIARPQFGFTNYIADRIDFTHVGSTAHHCSIHTAKLSTADIEAARAFLAQSGAVARGRAERRLIALSQDFLTRPAPEPGQDPCGGRQG